MWFLVFGILLVAIPGCRTAKPHWATLAFGFSIVVSVLVVEVSSHACESPSDDEETIVVSQRNHTELAETSRKLGQGIIIEFKDAPLSEVIDYLSITKQLRFRFDSADILKRRVTISAGGPGVKTHDVLASLFEHFNCEMSVLSTGELLVTPAPQAVLAMRQFFEAMQRQPAIKPWQQRAGLMTEQGFMELAGNLVWLALDQMHTANIDEFSTLFESYGVSDAAIPSDVAPYQRCTSTEEREAVQEAGRLRNKMFRRVLSQTKGKVYRFLDEIESLMTKHGIQLPEFDPDLLLQTVNANSATVVVRIDVLYERRRGFLEPCSGLLELEFRRLGDEWKYHRSTQ